MNQLKEKELETVRFIRNFIFKNKYAPSVREIADATETSKGSVIHDRMAAIRRKGYIGFMDKTPRALWITEKGEKLFMTTTSTIKGYETLTEAARKILWNTHKRHLSAMGEAEREKHSTGKIVKVKYNDQLQCVEVHFEKAGWYHYTPQGKWY